MKRKRQPRYLVFPAKSEEDGRNWLVRDTKNAEKPEDGRIVRPFRVLANAITEAKRLNSRDFRLRRRNL